MRVEESRPPEIGSQFRESRGVERILAKNPELQQRGLKFLIGLWIAADSREDVDGKQSLGEVIRNYAKDYPDCLIEHNVVDSDLPYKSFKPDPQVISALELVFDEAR